MRSVVTLAIVAMTASPLAAQRGLVLPPEYKDIQADKLDAQHRLLGAMVDSMPERLYRDRATPVQRDFAEQIYHAASSVGFIAARFIFDAPSPFNADTAKMLNSKEELRAFVNEVFEWAHGALEDQPDEDRSMNVTLFGNNMPKWQIWDEIHQHTIWTTGALVANFRKHGMAPPGFSFF